MSAQTVNTTVPSTSNGISYTPTDSWEPIQAPGATDGQAEFLLGDSVNGLANSFITYTFTQPATGFEYWGYQRSDGGLFSLCFDCPPTYTLGDRVDALNKSTNGTEPPRLLYTKYDLSYAIHNLTIANLFDSRATINGNTSVGGFGQMSLDRFILITPATAPTSSTQGSSTGTATGTTSSSSPSPTSPPAGGSSSNTGAIAGGVVGGLAVIAIIAAILFFLFRRKRRQRLMVQDINGGEHGLEYKEDGVDLQGNPVAPFILGPATQDGQTINMASWPTAAPPSSSGAPSSVYGGLAPPLPPTPAGRTAPRPKGARQISAEPVTRASEVVTSPSVYPATSESSGPTAGLNALSPRRDQDAGFLQGDELEPDILPPDYDAATSRRRQAGHQ